MGVSINSEMDFSLPLSSLGGVEPDFNVLFATTPESIASLSDMC